MNVCRDTRPGREFTNRVVNSNRVGATPVSSAVRLVDSMVRARFLLLDFVENWMALPLTSMRDHQTLPRLYKLMGKSLAGIYIFLYGLLVGQKVSGKC